MKYDIHETGGLPDWAGRKLNIIAKKKIIKVLKVLGYAWHKGRSKIVLEYEDGETKEKKTGAFIPSELRFA